jgi:hypothetical protein
LRYLQLRATGLQLGDERRAIAVEPLNLLLHDGQLLLQVGVLGIPAENGSKN